MDKSYPGSEGRILIEAEVNDFLPRYDYYKAEICREETGKLIIKIREGYTEGEEESDDSTQETSSHLS